jgi:hypothetical protein
MTLVARVTAGADVDELTREQVQDVYDGSSGCSPSCRPGAGRERVAVCLPERRG